MNQKLLLAGALAVGALAFAFFAGEPAPAPLVTPASDPPAVAVPSEPVPSAPSGVVPPTAVPVAAMLREPEKKPDVVRVLIAAESESVLAAQMAGRIVAINARLGERIKEGQIILRFDCEEQHARLNMARAEFDGAQKVHEAKAKLQALQSASLLEVSQAAAEVAKFKAQIQLIQAQIRLCSIHAPFTGRVTKLRVKPFESVVVGQQLVDVVNDERLKVQLNIPSLWLAQVKVNDRFAVRIEETGKTYEARLRRINGKVDAVSQSIEIEGELLGRPDDLLPGMSGIAIFPDVMPVASKS